MYAVDTHTTAGALTVQLALVEASAHRHVDHESWMLTHLTRMWPWLVQ